MIVVKRTYLDVNALDQCRYDRESQKDDGKDWHGIIVPKPWGMEYEVDRKGAWSTWRLLLEYGAETSMHCHPLKRTILRVESGQIVFETLEGSHEMWPGDAVYIPAGVFHRSRAVGCAVLLEDESPPVKNDLVRLSDKYGRGQGYAAR